MDGIKFEFNDMILYTENDSELRRFVSVDILFYFNIVISYY